MNHHHLVTLAYVDQRTPDEIFEIGVRNAPPEAGEIVTILGENAPNFWYIIKTERVSDPVFAAIVYLAQIC